VLIFCLLEQLRFKQAARSSLMALMADYHRLRYPYSINLAAYQDSQTRDHMFPVHVYDRI
jgi:hypothetical protein